MMRVLLTTASALALLAAPALAATTPTPPGAGASGATTSGSTASQSTTNPSAGASTKAMGAQTGTAEPAGNATSPATNRLEQQRSRADQTFVKKAASGNMAEVQMGKLAAQKSRNPAVQEFGRWMQTDHTMANALLMQAAKSSNIQVPTTPGPADYDVDAEAANAERDAVQSPVHQRRGDGSPKDHQAVPERGAERPGRAGEGLREGNAAHPAGASAGGAGVAVEHVRPSHCERRRRHLRHGNTAIGAGNAGTAKLNAQELNKIQHR